MCTNALLDSLECYLEDIVDEFEDFIKKSFIAVSLGIASIVFLFLYALRSISERGSGQPQAESTNTRVRSDFQAKGKLNQSQIETYEVKTEPRSGFKREDDDEMRTSLNIKTEPSNMSNMDEEVVQNVGYCCSRV